MCYKPQVTSLLCRRMGDRTLIYSSSVDGSIALCEEVSGPYNSTPINIEPHYYLPLLILNRITIYPY